jgi:glycosyltransferase involved in cell wall biosynthesis
MVSVCVPTFNGVQVVAGAIDSALEQDYAHFEIVVVDDASNDGTTSLLRRRYGGHVRLLVSDRRSGHNRNWNATIQAAAGPFVKFLHQDDRLHPQALSKMAGPLVKHPDVGMVFSRRGVELGSSSGEERAWLSRYGSVHKCFSDLHELNDGASLLRQALAAGLRGNWVGEPSNVMIRRECLERIGAFSLYVRQVTDLDLWLRLMAHYRVGFVDEELAVYRYAAGSLTGTNRTSRLDWLDRLWILEGLRTYRPVARDFPELADELRKERRTARRTVGSTLLGRQDAPPPIQVWMRYMLLRPLIRFRVKCPFGRIGPGPSTATASTQRSSSTSGSSR